jgi:hypothetical protein
MVRRRRCEAAKCVLVRGGEPRSEQAAIQQSRRQTIDWPLIRSLGAFESASRMSLDGRTRKYERACVGECVSAERRTAGPLAQTGAKIGTIRSPVVQKPQIDLTNAHLELSKAFPCKGAQRG